MTAGGAAPGSTTPAPRTLSIEVDGVRLHALEWGAGGDALVLTPGLGQSAHVFRELGPALAADGRVVALTPRGHGESGTPPAGYTVAGLAADLRGALHALGIARTTLVAHSVSGAVATRLGADHPERVRGIVYLDGIHDYTRWDEVVRANPYPPPPQPFFADARIRRAWHRRYVPGFWCAPLDADLAARPGPADESRRLELLAEVVHDVQSHPPPYASLRGPLLALTAGEDVATQFPWLDPADAAARQRAEAYLRDVRAPWRRASAERFLHEAPHARVAEVPGGHFFFLSARDRVVDEVRAFLRTLPPDAS
ncbi:alpha/beta hydrolase [Longimicrobium sp.]|uniref:alpha/beta fold hydrolase n=1 Tax=Longimicrobium sp. TaxID=2029185 RepID=UPI002E300CDA|nr:alpha/beta hydrolase [Longimicrobium sp.]HEX6037407.1 alpha/beta hydrolase [Longimicrobium sp.]